MTENKKQGAWDGFGRPPAPPSTRITFWIEIEVSEALKKLPWGKKSALVNHLLKTYLNEEGTHNGNAEL